MTVGTVPVLPVRRYAAAAVPLAWPGLCLAVDTCSTAYRSGTAAAYVFAGPLLFFQLNRNDPGAANKGTVFAMSLVSLPSDLAGLRPATFCLIEADYRKVLELCRTSWTVASCEGWMAWHELPCLFDMTAVDTYAGQVQWGVLGESASRPGQACLWTEQSDRAWSMLSHLASALRCRIVSTALCRDWKSPDALGELTVLHGNASSELRIVRVMRDGGRLEFFERGDPQDFERVENYAKRLLKDRVSEDVLLSYWRELGVDVGAELSDWAGRVGVAYVKANSTPLKAGAAFRAA